MGGKKKWKEELDTHKFLTEKWEAKKRGKKKTPINFQLEKVGVLFCCSNFAHGQSLHDAIPSSLIGVSRTRVTVIEIDCVTA